MITLLIENGVLDSKPLWFKILKFIYNSLVIGHFSYTKTYKIA